MFVPCQMHQIFPTMRNCMCPEMSLKWPGTRHLFPLMIPLHQGTWDCLVAKDYRCLGLKGICLAKRIQTEATCCVSQHFRWMKIEKRQGSHWQWCFLMGWLGAISFPFQCLSFHRWKMGTQLMISFPKHSELLLNIYMNLMKGHIQVNRKDSAVPPRVPGELCWKKPSAHNWRSLLHCLA